MVEEQVGLRSNQPRELPLWTKLFSGFKVALDPKKLLLAAAGILVMSIGWYVLSWIFYGVGGNKPEWTDYKATIASYSGETDKEKEKNAFDACKQARSRWNLRYAMAAPVPSVSDLHDKAREGIVYFDDLDAADTLSEYRAIEQAKIKIEDWLNRPKNPVRVNAKPTSTMLEIPGGPTIDLGKIDDKDKAKKLEDLAKGNGLKVKDLAVVDVDDKRALQIRDLILTVPDAKSLDQLEQYRRGAKSVDQIRLEARARDDQATLQALDLLLIRHLRPAGQFRTWPWFEYRGPNPYLMVTDSLKETAPGGTVRGLPWENHGFMSWFLGDEIPVLLEPLVKFLRPIRYLLYPAAGGWNRIYLILIILWTLATWGVFGGAITRMAAVQVARTNEKVGMTEALRFAWARIQAYFSAPVLPLVFLAILTLFLWLYGLVGIWLFPVGDILVYGVFAPIMLLIGLIMAVVLIGLVGWPLMYSTISTEGSDSFDAISRSYSYVYQAPWHYLWYTAVALAYGAVLVFFVGLMGSLMVYLGKWGISQAPGPQSRAPTYLFVYAPTSFGWRDLLLHDSPGVETVRVAHNNGTEGLAYAPTPHYWSDMSWNNHVGAFLVSVWLFLLFLMIVGFGYSYFWSASTIIYLLMRRKVDDTDLDEIHLEEEDLEEPYSAPTPAAPPTAADKAPSAGLNVTMVEPPTMRTSSPPGSNPGGAAPTAEVAAGPAAVEAAVANPPPATPGPAVTPPPGGDKEHSGEGEKE